MNLNQSQEQAIAAWHRQQQAERIQRTEGEIPSLVETDSVFAGFEHEPWECHGFGD